MSGDTVTGSRSTPDSSRLTFATSAACFFGGKFLWTMPTPPSCAMAIARRDSVTVSIAAETSGMLSWILRVSLVFRPTSRGRTFEWAGTRRTSSKVRAFWTGRIATPKSRIIRCSHLPVNSAECCVHRAIDWRVKTRYGPSQPLEAKLPHDPDRAVRLHAPRPCDRPGAGLQVRRRRRESLLFAGPVSGGNETGRYVPQTDLGPCSRSRCSVRRQGCKRRAGQERRSQDRGRAGTGVPQAPAGPGKGGQGIRREIRRSAAQTGELPQRTGAARAIRDRRPRGALQRARRALLPR